jgi:PilZ domain
MYVPRAPARILPMTVATERRLSPRYPAVHNAAVVEFRTRRKSRIARASLINISTTGALLRMREKPRLMSTLWVRLVYPVKTPAVRATVVRVGDDGKVLVAFGGACNRTFFWTATRGEDFRSVARDGLRGTAIKLANQLLRGVRIRRGNRCRFKEQIGVNSYFSLPDCSGRPADPCGSGIGVTSIFRPAPSRDG